MLHFTSVFVLTFSFIAATVIPKLSPRNDAAPLMIDFTVSSKVGNTTAREFWSRISRHTRAKRGSYTEVITDVGDISYTLDVYLGSNNQESTVTLDTGSSDLWVPSSDYDSNSSSTANATGEAFSIGYVDGTSATGEYYLDKFQFNSSQPLLSSFQFAVADVDSSGILGIADKNQEAAEVEYDNLPWALQKAGLTPKASYSLFLGPDHSTGSVIFGGIDTEKYSGNLTKYPVDTSKYQALAVKLETLSINGKNFTLQSPYILDSGTSLGFVSQDVMDELDTIFNTSIVTEGNIQYRTTSCNQPTDQFLEFDFGQNTISLSYADAVAEQDDGTCFLGFSYYEGYQILGDVFLRKAYVYYDLTDQTISLAEASYSSSSNIISG